MREEGPIQQPEGSPSPALVRPRLAGAFVIACIAAVAGAVLGPLVTEQVKSGYRSDSDVAMIDVEPEQAAREQISALGESDQTGYQSFYDGVYYDGQLFVSGFTGTSDADQRPAIWLLGTDNELTEVSPPTSDGSLWAMAQHPANGIVAIGQTGAATDHAAAPLLYHSSDGSAWDEVSLERTSDNAHSHEVMRDVIWSDLRSSYVAVGWSADQTNCAHTETQTCQAHVWLSNNGVDWLGAAIPAGTAASSSAHAVAEVHNTVVIGGVADESATVWLVSNDESTKVTIDDRPSMITALAERDGHLYAAGVVNAKADDPDFVVWQSSDSGNSWTVRFEQARPATQTVYDLTVVNGLLAFAGQDADGLTSMRGALWLSNADMSAAGLRHPAPGSEPLSFHAVIAQRDGGMTLLGQAGTASSFNGIVVQIDADAVDASQPRQQTPQDE